MSGRQAPTPTDPDDPGKPPPPPPLEIPKGRSKAYAKIAKGAMHAIGGVLNMVIAVDDDDKAFLPDEDDDATIPPPLGRLAARRVPIGGDGDDFSDIEDIGQALVGLIAWALKGLTEHLTARRERGPKGRRQQLAKLGVAGVYDGTGEAGGDPPA